MFKALAQLWAALATLFGAIQRGANAIDHLVGVGELMAKQYAMESRAELIGKINALPADIRQQVQDEIAAEKAAAVAIQ